MTLLFSRLNRVSIGAVTTKVAVWAVPFQEDGRNKTEAKFRFGQSVPYVDGQVVVATTKDVRRYAVGTT